jgi:DNA-directed RNA polymerase I subunit RPA2
MKTTTVRKLLPEAWGFICPVHTPDGTPCGLLNHITLSCVPLPYEEMSWSNHGKFKKLLTEIGMEPIGSDFGMIYPSNFLPIMLDGKLIGYVDPKISVTLVTKLRRLKIAQLPEYSWLPKGLEVAFLPTEEIIA